MRAVLVAALALAACGGEPPAPGLEALSPPRSVEAPRLPAAFADRLAEAGLEAEPLDGARGYGLARVASDSGAYWVQWVDLRANAVRQVLGPRVEGVVTASAFHPTAPSPRFRLLEPGGVVRAAVGEGARTVLNGAFFETPGRPASQLAFPLATGGTVRTGGSSPYGPGRPGAEAARWGAPLRALGLDSLARVGAYDPATGAPLGAPGFGEAVVSYAPDAHPTRIATRFHVLGPLAGGRVLAIVTSDGLTRIDAAAGLLARLGVAPDRQVALDGGASVLVWNQTAGLLEAPTPAGGRGPQSLPHYLAIGPR